MINLDHMDASPGCSKLLYGRHWTMITAGPQLHIVEEVALTIVNVPEQKYIERLSQSYKQRFIQT